MMRWVRNDAQNRAWRTALQGIVATVVLPALVAGLQVVSNAMSGGGEINWQVVGGAAMFAAMTAAVMSFEAYVHRAVVDPSSVPSALPPRPPGVSAAEAPFTAPSPRPPTRTGTG